MMRRRAVMVLAAAALAVPAAAQVAAKDLATTLKGNWVVDKVAALEAAAPPAYKSATPEKQKEMREALLKGMPDMIIEFSADKATMKAGEQTPEVATYKITRQEKNTVWLDLTPQGKTAAETEKLSLEFVDDDTVKMMKEGDPAALRLNRQK